MKKVDLKMVKRVEHPLAKYNSAGQLFCLLCNIPLKNQNLWTAHINGRVHAENVQALKAKKRPQQSDGSTDAPPPKKPSKSPASVPVSTPATPLKSILVSEFKTPLAVGPGPSSAQFKPELPSSSTAAKVQFLEENEKNDRILTNGASSHSVQFQSPSEEAEPELTPEAGPSKSKGLGLPEGFFDDPKLDAKARGLEWRDPEEVEWENFVKEIAGEDIKSSSMRVVDEEESTKVRELEEIEEQMAHWQKVIDLERKAEEIREKQKLKEQSAMETEEIDDDDDDYDEDLDWRSKRR